MDFKLPRRAGTLKYKSLTVTVVPLERTTGNNCGMSSKMPATFNSRPIPLSSLQLVNVNLDTAAVAANASPRNPKVAIPCKWATSAILLVANRVTAIIMSSG